MTKCPFTTNFSFWWSVERTTPTEWIHGRPKRQLKVEKIGRPAPEIEGLVIAIGLSPLIGCSVVTGDLGLIFVLVERWHGETSSFHLPVGELTITLDDVSSLLHLSITGALHSFEPLVMEEAVILLMELLEVSGQEARAETAQARRAYVRLLWVWDIYLSRCEARWWIIAARAYLLHLVGCTLFTNKSATHVHVVHLEDFRDLGESGSVHDCVTDDPYDETSPRAYRWLTTKAYIKGLRAPVYQTCLDALTIIDMCWMPYVRPDRVVRQFEYVQTIPPLSVSASLSYEDIDDRWMHYEDHIADAGEIFVVLGQVSADYMEWFFQISHSFVTPTQAGDEPRHPPAPQHEEYVESSIPEVLVGADVGPSQAPAMDGCEAIAERLERVLNLRMVTEDTELHEIVEDCLRIARGLTAQMEI
ncbi:protein MAIN-LIKE 1-like [Glycine soja]|uniref:protein MAIN-LIKE 1-like n=1 Tax=Glycine soja TaxID=3848 RepID=UPI001040841B|nr:protein MAIN-LIKE 1-like [Glycine soja]